MDNNWNVLLYKQSGNLISKRPMGNTAHLRKQFIYDIIMLIKSRNNPLFTLFFIWTNLNPLYPRKLCAKFGWNWSSSSGEECEKCTIMPMTTTTTTMNNKQILIRKAHLSLQLRWAKNELLSQDLGLFAYFMYTIMHVYHTLISLISKQLNNLSSERDVALHLTKLSFLHWQMLHDNLSWNCPCGSIEKKLRTNNELISLRKFTNWDFRSLYKLELNEKKYYCRLIVS